MAFLSGSTALLTTTSSSGISSRLSIIARSGANAKGAGVYATSVLISENGCARDSEILQSYAIEHSMGVLMANHGGPSGGWACAGRSAFWSPGGDPVASASGAGDCLVIARRRQGTWQGQVVEVSLHSVLPAL